MLAYAVLKRFISLFIWVWYRRIIVIGAHHVPRRRPVLLCGNHQNMVHDPFLIALTVPYKRQCHFWAMKELFTPWSSSLLRSLGAVPVDRQTKDNALLFKDTLETLQADGCMALFPEGNSTHEPHLLQLKDGASRAALEFAKYIWETDGKPDPTTYHSFRTALIVPVGINYECKDAWRSQVVVEYGQPIEIDDYLAAFVNDDAKTTTKRLTERLYMALRGLTVNAPDWETLHLIYLSNRIVVPRSADLTPELEVKLLQSFSDAYSKTADDPKVCQLRKDLETYRDRLASRGLDDYHVEKHAYQTMTTSRAVRHCLTSAWAFVRSIPYILPGAILHSPILLLALWTRARQKYAQQIAQDILGIMLVTVPLLYVFVAMVVMFYFRTSLLVGVVTVVLLGVSATWQLEAWDRGKDLLHELRANIVLARHAMTREGRNELDQLADMRSSIQRFMLKIVDSYRNSDDVVAVFISRSLTTLRQ